MLRQMVVACAMLACGGQAYADRCHELIATVKSGTATAPNADTATAQDMCEFFTQYNDETRRSIEAKREYEQRNCRKTTGLEYKNSSSKDAAALNSKFIPMQKSYCAEAAAERVAAERAQSKSPPPRPPGSSSSSANSRPTAPVVIPVPVPTPPAPPQQQATAEPKAPEKTPAAARSTCVVSVSHKHDDVYHLWNECSETKKWIVLDTSEYETKACVRQVIELAAGSLRTSMSYNGKAPEIRFQCSDGGNCQPKKLVARFGRNC